MKKCRHCHNDSCLLLSTHVTTTINTIQEEELAERLENFINQKGEPNGDPDGDETYEAGDILQKWNDTDWQTDFRKFVKDDGQLSVCLCGYAKISFLNLPFFYLVFP